MKGISYRGNHICFGRYALQALEPAWITSRQIEAGRRAMSRNVRRGGQIWVRIFPDKKEQEEKRRIAVGEAWDSFIVAQVIRGSLLITQSILRKYIVLPSLIIIKNIVRMLLFQFPEWSEDFRDWNREMYIKCTYNGVQLSETEFPKNWLLDGIQIQIRFPFHTASIINDV
ncbi:hypothetical protein AHAS_AhasUnG0032000 [Arachis hypogaea]